MASAITGNLASITRTADAKATAAQAARSDAMGKDQFLKLFTTQLQNQNPLDPVKNEAFVAQLAQFSQLEATTNMSSSLSALVSSLKGDRMMTGSALIGRTVAAPNAPAVLNGGNPVNAVIDLPNGADKVKVEIFGADGKPVRTVQISQQKVGLAAFTWDGMDDAGKPLPDGSYSLVATATIAGKDSAVSIGPMSTVRSVSSSTSSSDPVLELDGGASVNLSTVMRVGQ
jgi:flagellar basal-body rod modification protein FlgD